MALNRLYLSRWFDVQKLAPACLESHLPKGAAYLVESVPLTNLRMQRCTSVALVYNTAHIQHCPPTPSVSDQFSAERESQAASSSRYRGLILNPSRGAGKSQLIKGLRGVAEHAVECIGAEATEPFVDPIVPTKVSAMEKL